MSRLAVKKRIFHRQGDPDVLTVCEAVKENHAEVLEFLSERPIHTFGMTGMIVTNGLVSPLNRGTFYICRNQSRGIEGIALIGYDNLFEVKSDAAIAAFAKLFCNHIHPRLLLGEEEKVDAFCHYVSEFDSLDADSQRYILFKQSWPIDASEPVRNLRPATLDDLELVVRAHALAGLEESGIDRLELDPEGFTERCANRIKNQTTWIWAEENHLIFKVEIITATPDVHYLESVWVAPEERKKGYALRCLRHLGRHLLQYTSAICLLASETNIPAQALYEQAGFKNLGYYRALFFRDRANA